MESIAREDDKKLKKNKLAWILIDHKKRVHYGEIFKHGQLQVSLDKV